MKYKDIGNGFYETIRLDIFKGIETEIDSKSLPNFTPKLNSSLTTEIYWQLSVETQMLEDIVTV